MFDLRMGDGDGDETTTKEVRNVCLGDLTRDLGDLLRYYCPFVVKSLAYPITSS